MIFISHVIGKDVNNPLFPDKQKVQAPGVVWEMGGRGGLSTAEAEALIEDLGAFGSPFIMFAGHGKRLREDLLHLIRSARRQAIAAVLVLTRATEPAGFGRMLADAGTSLVLMDADAPDATDFLEDCGSAGVPVGVRQQLTSHESIAECLALARRTRCSISVFQHPETIRDIDGQQTRDLMNDVYQAAQQSPIMIATEGNTADAVYMYLRLRQDDPRPAKELRTAIFRADTARLHADMAYVNADGAVYPEEHWRWGVVGNVREKLFSQIWTDPEQPLLRGLRLRRLLIQGRCKTCGYLEVCNGNQRARAESMGNLWAEDPGCYLTDDEVKHPQ
ncbi:MAG TPA: SPASM domain-containing protein [Symbiobacteriaceae bacterium]|nr:SPASM domain-containing protein [Symbiobacteriaceae bacterium]